MTLVLRPLPEARFAPSGRRARLARLERPLLGTGLALVALHRLDLALVAFGLVVIGFGL